MVDAYGLGPYTLKGVEVQVLSGAQIMDRLTKGIREMPPNAEQSGRYLLGTR